MTSSCVFVNNSWILLSIEHGEVPYFRMAYGHPIVHLQHINLSHSKIPFVSDFVSLFRATAVQSKPLVHSTAISPVHFPRDFATTLSRSNDQLVFRSEDILLGDAKSLGKLKSMYDDDVTIPSIVISAFAAVLRRVTGWDDGMFAVSLADKMPFTLAFAGNGQDTL